MPADKYAASLPEHHPYDTRLRTAEGDPNTDFPAAAGDLIRHCAVESD
jgi:hypothetical protein